MKKNVQRNLAERPAQILTQAQVVVVAIVTLALLLGLSNAVGAGITGTSAAVLALVEKLIARPSANSRAIEAFARVEDRAVHGD